MRPLERQTIQQVIELDQPIKLKSLWDTYRHYPDAEISFGRYYTEDLCISFTRDENDLEYQERMKKEENKRIQQERQKEKRRQKFLELKKEFENDEHL